MHAVRLGVRMALGLGGVVLCQESVGRDQLSAYASASQHGRLPGCTAG